MRKKRRNSALQYKMHKVMREFAAGTLRSSSGEKVTSRQQALAIGESEGRAMARKMRKHTRRMG